MKKKLFLPAFFSQFAEKVRIAKKTQPFSKKNN